jgi:ketosteroid isomerase-like protein
VLVIIETDKSERMKARVVFDHDDFVSAIAELDARYLAGEAAAHAHTWSIIARAYAGFNRGELPARTPDGVDLDHRHAAAMAPGDGAAYFHASWELAAELSVYIESVHRLSDVGAVFTHAGKGTSKEGFEAEWRTVDIMTVDGDFLGRGELFDEADLELALLRFEELRPQAPRLDNAATRVGARMADAYNRRDRPAYLSLATPDGWFIDRRKGLHSELEAAMRQNLEAVFDVSPSSFEMTWDPIAVRGSRLSLAHEVWRDHGQDDHPVAVELLTVIEVSESGLLDVGVAFDIDDLDTAIAELDARYLAGEGSAQAQTWSLITRTYAAFNEDDVPKTDWPNIDHRRGTPFAAVDLSESIGEAKALTPDLCVRIEAVHRLESFGAVITNMSRGTSEAGFDAEWRMIQVFIVDGDRVTRCELFDEADINAALQQFEESRPQAPRLENAATRNWTRIADAYNRRDLDGFLSLAAKDGSLVDRRRGLHSVQEGPAMRENLQAMLDVSPACWRMMVKPIAERGSKLSLTHARWVDDDQADHPATIELLGVMEVNDRGLMHANVSFDIDDIDAALAELDARYLAGEAADHTHTWSVITRGYAALNRNELAPTTDDWTSVDHRRGVAFSPGDLPEYLRAGREITPDGHIYIEDVHRICPSGAVVTHVVKGTSRDGFDAEWREICMMVVDGDALSRLELFDEGDLSAALIRFDEFRPQARSLRNAAAEALERFQACFSAQDWNAIVDTLGHDFVIDDRRLAVNSGIGQGRDAVVERMRLAADLGTTNVTSTVIATRGDRLLIAGASYSGDDYGAESFRTELLSVVEADGGGRLTAQVVFDREDIDAAFDELEARYLAGEAAGYFELWSEIAQGYAAMNNHELSATTSDWMTVDHRVHATFEGDDLAAYVRSAWDVTPGVRIRIEAVHRLSHVGAVVTHTAYGTSQDGFEAEWRMIVLLSTHGGSGKRCEIFDEQDLEAALASFDER